MGSCPVHYENLLVSLKTGTEISGKSGFSVRHYVSKTVLLELEWVLRGVYELDRDTVVRALLQILGLSNVVAEAPEQVALALEYHQQGLDFADALHLTSANYDVFHTFDASFAKLGKRLGLPVKPVDSPSTSGSI